MAHTCADGIRQKQLSDRGGYHSAGGCKAHSRGVLNDSPFSSTDSTIVICTEETFHQLTGQNRYAVIDIQLEDTTADAAIAQIHTLLSDTLNNQVIFSNRIEGNRMIQSTYWAFHLVVYAFLIVIAGITILNIVNSISMSVSARMKQYGILRAIGMDDAQLKRMILPKLAPMQWPVLWWALRWVLC